MFGFDEMDVMESPWPVYLLGQGGHVRLPLLRLYIYSDDGKSNRDSAYFLIEMQKFD